MKKPNKKIMVLFLFINLILISSIASVNSTQINFTSTTLNYGDSNHEPIFINGNDDFTSENGVTGGSGTEEDPYIISDWIIEGDGVSDYGIFINNTDAFFIINNCNISGFTGAYINGIYFKNVINGCVTFSSVFNNAGGIGIKNSNKIRIENCSSYDNNIYSYSTGIWSWDSQNVAITDCDIFANSGGIDFTDTPTSAITHSSVHDNEDTGILLYGENSKNNVVKYCDVFDNGYTGIDMYCDGRQVSTYNIISNCYVARNGLPDIGANGFPGIAIWFSSDNLIENCTIDANGRGIGIDASKNNIIRNCTISNHRNNEEVLSEGIVIVGLVIDTRNNRIIHCDIVDNEIGAMVGFSLTTIFQKNNIINNSYFGVQTLAILTCKIKNNNIIHNGYKETFSKSINAWTSPYIDARHNWWGTEKGPSVFGFNDRPKIGLYLSIVRVRPWFMEPVPNAGRQT